MALTRGVRIPLLIVFLAILSLWTGRSHGETSLPDYVVEQFGTPLQCRQAR